MKNSILLFLFIGVLIWIGCAKDMFVQEEFECDEVVTHQDLLPIIENSCAYSGCHDGQTEMDYTSYSAMETDFGEMKRRVIDLNDMPPGYATGPLELSEEELRLFSCWIEQDFPEN